MCARLKSIILRLISFLIEPRHLLLAHEVLLLQFTMLGRILTRHACEMSWAFDRAGLCAEISLEIEHIGREVSAALRDWTP